MATAETIGEWGNLFPLKNVAVHATLLPSGKVLYWGRRSDPTSMLVSSLDEQITKPFILDPETLQSTATDLPTLADNSTKVNLFCSGHCLQPDGTLFVVGGHIVDGQGARQACVYDPSQGATGKWTAKPLPNNGRWYPSAQTLPDGRVLVVSGSFDNSFHVDNIPEIWNNTLSPSGGWKNVVSPPIESCLYPRLHLAPDGTIFVTGTLAQSHVLNLDVPPNSAGALGAWADDTKLPSRAALERQYGYSVTYDSGKIIYIGGGNEKIIINGVVQIGDGNQFTGPPTAATETIDLNQKDLKWTKAADMKIPRRQHNATTLPDGTVLVTGGTQGNGFNDLTAGRTVHTAELWNPDTNKWTKMALESADRCYHSISLLLPSGQVLSAGSGEYGGGMGVNALQNAQVFSPPYLFKGPRPSVTGVPKVVVHGKQFDVTIAGTDAISKVTWIRHGSVTHSMNMNQGVVIQRFATPEKSKITVKVPINPGFIAPLDNPGFAPPGHYMLFFVNARGVPSVASLIRIDADPQAQKASALRMVAPQALTSRQAITVADLNDKIIAEQQAPAVAVGITPICPYGLGPCWAGAAEGLRAIKDVDVVRPLPDQATSVAYVYLKDDILPDLDAWRNEFAKTVNGSYGMRGIEMTLSGKIITRHVSGEDKLVLAGTETRADLILTPFKPSSSIKWEPKTAAVPPISNAEAAAYSQLSKAVKESKDGLSVRATGTLQRHGAKDFSLDVREFEVLNDITK